MDHIDELEVAEIVNNTGSCSSLPDFNPKRCQVIFVLRKLFSGLSLLGCLFIFLVMWLFRRYRLFVQRLLLFLAISTAIYSINNIIASENPPRGWCTTEALIRQFAIWATLLWEAVITLNLVWNAVKQEETEHFERYYHTLVWTIAVMVSVTPLIFGVYGPTGAWCWVGPPVLRLLLFHIPNFIILCLMFVGYGLVLFVLYKKDLFSKGLHNQHLLLLMRNQVRPLILYPLIFLGLSIFPVINRIQNYVGDSPVFWLTLLHTMSIPMRGFALAIVYALDPEMRSKLNTGHIEAAMYRARNATIKGEYKIGDKVVKSSVPGTEDIIEEAIGLDGSPAESELMPS